MLASLRSSVERTMTITSKAVGKSRATETATQRDSAVSNKSVAIFRIRDASIESNRAISAILSGSRYGETWASESLESRNVSAKTDTLLKSGVAKRWRPMGSSSRVTFSKAQQRRAVENSKGFRSSNEQVTNKWRQVTNKWRTSDGQVTNSALLICVTILLPLYAVCFYWRRRPLCDSKTCVITVWRPMCTNRVSSNGRVIERRPVIDFFAAFLLLSSMSTGSNERTPPVYSFSFCEDLLHKISLTTVRLILMNAETFTVIWLHYSRRKIFLDYTKTEA